MRSRGGSSDGCSSDLAAMHVEPEGFQLLRHERRGPFLLERGLGVAMQLAPPRGQVGVEVGDAVDDRHAVRSLGGSTMEGGGEGALGHARGAWTNSTTQPPVSAALRQMLSARPPRLLAKPAAVTKSKMTATSSVDLRVGKERSK